MVIINKTIPMGMKITKPVKFTYTITSGYAWINGLDESEGTYIDDELTDIVIPATIDGYVVRRVGDLSAYPINGKFTVDYDPESTTHYRLGSPYSNGYYVLNNNNVTELDLSKCEILECAVAKNCPISVIKGPKRYHIRRNDPLGYVCDTSTTPITKIYSNSSTRRNDVPVISGTPLYISNSVLDDNIEIIANVANADFPSFHNCTNVGEIVISDAFTSVGIFSYSDVTKITMIGTKRLLAYQYNKMLNACRNLTEIRFPTRLISELDDDNDDTREVSNILGVDLYDTARQSLDSQPVSVLCGKTFRGTYPKYYEVA